MVDNDNAAADDDNDAGACVYYKVTYEPSGFPLHFEIEGT